MSVQHLKRNVVSIAGAIFLLATAGPTSAQAPAQQGVYYATLGNNGSDPGALITIDIATGAGALVGATGISGEFDDKGVPALAITTNGEIYAMDIGSAANLYRIDAATGAATLVIATNLSSPPAIAFDGADGLWAVDNLGSLHRVNATTGATTPVGATGAFIKGLAFDPTDGILWGSDASSNIYTIDLSTGKATLVGGTGRSPSADIHFDAAGVLYGSTGGGLSGNSLITIDKSTGQGTVVGSIGFASVSGMATRLARVLPATVQSFGSRWARGHVEVRWRLADIAGALYFNVARAADGGRFEKLHNTAVSRSGDEFTLVDTSVEPGTRYRYNVEVIEDGNPVASFETSVATPAVSVSLGKNYPNPFNAVTQIPFSVDAPARVSLSVYDAAGRLVRRLVDRPSRPGEFVEAWDGRDATGSIVPAGIYFYRLRTGKRSLTKKAVRLR